jgi:hypothetical protein
VGARHAEELRCFVRGEGLAAGDGSDGLAACVGIDGEEQLLTNGVGQRAEIDRAGAFGVVGDMAELFTFGFGEVGWINDDHW